MGTEWGMTMEKGQTGICTAPKRRTVRNGRTLFVLILGLLHELKRNEREWITYQIGLHKWDSSRTQEDTTRSYGRSARKGDTLLLCGKREKGGNWPLITLFVNLLAKIYCRFLIRNKFHLKFYDETTVSWSSLGDMLAQPGSRQRNFNEEPSLPFGDAYKKTTRTTAADYGNNRRWRRSCCIIMLAIRNL